MNATEIQALNTGAKVLNANGKVLTVTDWKCHKDVVMLGNVRIWAEPYFDGNLMHPHFWNELTPLKK